MRTLSAAMLAHLASDVQTLATLWTITRTDGQVFGFTDLDQPITYGGVTYQSAGGYTHSQIDMTSDMSTSNLEVNAIFDSSAITPASLEAGQWDYARVQVSLVNYADLTMGAVLLESGVLGQVVLLNGTYKAELRGLAQVMQQEQGQTYSPTCRAVFGDARCQIDLGPLTFSGSIASVAGLASWNDPTLTQVGPTVSFTDTRGQKVPTHTPFTIQIVPPTGGSFVADTSVRDNSQGTLTKVTGSPGNNQYSVSASGLYTFNSSAAGNEYFISYTYAIGFFAYGLVTFTSGQNAGFSMEVKSFSPGVVTLAMALPYPLAVGDTYTIKAGCDKQFGTCRDRYSNIVHFRGEPYIPGPDTILRPQG
ncbi:DUF2163 domain-containing protein [Paraburkholderia phymatum]|uniref:Bacteriophage phiJL001 Gp84 C-terminal domain-containing protein n=1 Tax=Paraburkholderia phymatum (strain DSM 17167 / CIP 108236 / LMG 21445 / STM815) TaxID=391038 RepID=B2JUI6_PARP8|nr:DUF2163 domain-containing protein [Paraburkholderia phymatum]ACC76157.1 conserved hypothetical protein [Paraburkholderia phymatum STM815]